MLQKQAQLSVLQFPPDVTLPSSKTDDEEYKQDNSCAALEMLTGQ